MMQHRFTKTMMAAAAIVFAFSLTALADGMEAGGMKSATLQASTTGAALQAGVTKTLHLTTGKAETVSLPKSVADVLVANPAVADVGSLRANRLYIVGKALGDTNVLAFDDEGNQLADIAVHVRVDEANLRDTLREFFPDEQIEAHTVNDSIILKGRVSNPSVANQVRDLAGRFIKTSGQTLVDLMTVMGEQQVMLKVKVIEARRDVLREYGIDTSLTGRAGDVRGSFFGNAGVGLTSLTQFGSGTLAVMGGASVGPVNVNIQGLERDGLINTLAEPTLTAISGESAGFLAGGEFPVPSGRDTSGNISIEFKQFGVSLNFIPTVLGNDRISMQLSSEVSEKSDQDSVTLATGGGSTVIPGLTVRRAQTTVQMGSGGTLMMAGLLKSRTVDAVNGFPGLKDLPILGDLFKSKSFQRGESELVFLVTPYIVEPYALPQAERVATIDAQPPRPILPMSADVPPQKPAFDPAATTANPPAAPGTRFDNIPRNAPAAPRAPAYPRQGQEERTAGTRKADATPVTAIPAAKMADAAPAEKPVAKTAEKPAAKPSEKLGEKLAEKSAADMTKEPVEKPAKKLIVEKAAAETSPLPYAPPGKNAAEQLTAEEAVAVPGSTADTPQKTAASTGKAAPAGATGPVVVNAKPAKAEETPAKDGEDKVADAAPNAGKDKLSKGKSAAAASNDAASAPSDSLPADPLTASFTSNLQKVYGNRVPVLGASAPYGYIVD